jgi:Ca2+-binding RTX toxin-like protein
LAYLRVYNSVGYGFDMSGSRNGLSFVEGVNSTAQFVGESRYDIDTYIWYYRDPYSDVAYEYAVFLSFPNIDEVIIESIYVSDNLGRPTFDYYNSQIYVPYDDLVSGSQSWILSLMNGGDIIVGNKYDDIIRGGNRNDYIVGNAGNDRLYGERGHDEIRGNAGRDRLYGGPGDDTLRGGDGLDRLHGGSGFDIFEYRSLSEAGIGRYRDIIIDFDIESDIIDLRSIDANEMEVGNQEFHFIGRARFTETAGELRFRNEVLSGDTDGDGSYDFQIFVADVVRLRELDLYL